MDPLRGEYGFLTEFSNITEYEARARVRHMVKVFGILEFQFYNAFEGYSRPPDEEREQWLCACFQKPVQRNILQAYTDEIRQWGGRSWLSIQAMGTAPNDHALQDGFTIVGQHKVARHDAPPVALPKRIKQAMTNHKDTLYTADVVMGGEKIQGILDTGSFELVVFGKSCTSCGTAVAYDHDKSSNYSKGTARKRLSYGSGSCRSTDGDDMVSCGGLKAEKQALINKLSTNLDSMGANSARLKE